MLERVNAECVSNGQKRHVVQWADTHMLTPAHPAACGDCSYKPAEITRCPEIGRRFGPAAGRRVAKVRWQEKEEPADNDTIPKELIEDFQARRDAAGHIRLAPMGKDACIKKDEHKNSLQRQGHCSGHHCRIEPRLLCCTSQGSDHAYTIALQKSLTLTATL